MRPRVLAIRDGAYKLVIRFKEGREDLYDLKNDPGECSPLPDDVAIRERVRLLQSAHAHMKESRENRNAELALSARLCGIKHSIEMHAEKLPA